jgi:8-amino-7-oxononanoate synthase
MEAQAWERSIRHRLDGLADQHLLRSRRSVIPLDATHVEVDGRRYVNFASNNYLGLSHHPRVVDAAAESLRRQGVGGGASPLLTGFSPAHRSAECTIAAWKGTESAVLLPSGYQANAAAVQTLAALGGDESGASGGRRLRFLLDKLCHASLIDAAGATGVPFRVFPHNHLSKLARLLDEADARETQVVVTESIFSMDGDAADLAGLAELKRRRPFVLLLDEAHASGVYGRAGSGLVDERNLPGLPDLSVVTLSKALGCAGGAVCGSTSLCDAVVNFGRSYVYSTTIAPALAAAAEAAIGVLREEPRHQQRLRQLAREVRARLVQHEFALPAGDSPIIPLVLGNEEAALKAASRMQEVGLWVVAIRPPTVPRGTSRLRITLSSQHTDDEIQLLVRSVTTFARTS